MLILLALGVWFSVFSGFNAIPRTMLFGLMLGLFALAGVAVMVLKSYRFHWLFGSIMACYLFLAGHALTVAHRSWEQKDYYRHFESSARYYVARVYDYPTERPNSIRAVLDLECQFGDSVSSREVSGKVMAYFRKSDSATALRYGDLVVIPAPVGELAPPMNPGEFDYRAYLMRRGITGQIFLNGDDWIDLQANGGHPLYAFSYRFRDKLLASLQRSGLSDNEFGVAAAILLGYDESLADEMRHKFVAAGSMHILCVSGMHVGIIYLLASLLLGFLNRRKWQRMLKQVLLLALIWFYALIAGLSPSILRAALMITFVVIGEMLQRKGFAINSIAASAFILLCVNPNNLFDIGFQLSYAAVMGIVVLQKPIYHLFSVGNKLLDKAWDITAVALAAQVATIPFTLFYFNQFTTYFWLSNLFMTPISFVVVVVGMLLLLVSWIPYINVLLGHLVWGAVYVMNWVVTWVDALPLSIIKGLYISLFEFSLLLIALVLLMLCVSLHKKRLFIAMLSTLLLFMVSVTWRLNGLDAYDGMTFFSLRQHTAVDFIKGGNHVLLADSTLLDDPSAVEYSLKGAWTMKNLSLHPEVIGFDDDVEGPLLRKKANLVSFDGKIMGLWNDALAVGDSLSYRIPVDFLLVTNRQRPDVQSVVNGYEVGMLLIDGSVPRHLVERWEAQAERLGVPCYALCNGAFELDMRK